MLHSFDHAVVAVADLERATSDFAALLGRPPSWRGVHPDAGTANALFRVENAYLELLAPDGDGELGAAIRGILAARGEGLVALAFGVDAAEACAQRWRERGLEPRGPEPGAGRDTETGAERAWSNVFLPTAATRGLQLFAIEHRTPESALPFREPSADPAVCAHALDHVVVTSADVDASARIYGDLLGLRLALDRSFEARGVRILFFRVGGVTVEVAGGLAPAPDPSAPDRFGGLAWRVGDADGARERLAGEGFDVSEARPGAKPGTRVFSVRDRTAGVPTLVIGPGG